MNWLRPLLLMFYAPTRGMAEVRDRVPLGQAALLAVLFQVAHALVAQWRELGGLAARFGAWAAVGVLFSSAGSVLLVALVYAPLTILFANLFERRGGFGLVLRQEYGAAASTTFYALAAASLAALPLAYLDQSAGLSASVRGSLLALNETMLRASPDGPTEEEARALWAGLATVMPRAALAMLIQPLILFSLWAVAAVREVFRVAWWKAALVVVFSAVLMMPALALLPILSALLASPFLVLLVFFVVRSYVGEAQRAQRARASFRQNLEAATLNPADASAHYNLGLLHQQRKEYAEARTRFLRAVEIDPEEADAHYQLGRIARAEGRLPEAIAHFGEVVTRDDAHAQHEIWREVGATYLAAGQFGDARDALERFLARRTSDPEALYLMGRAAAGLGDPGGAREWMQRCVEAVRTAPAYKYRADKRWLNEAQQFLRTQA
ncbi:MAG TPA: tetratricopeptide repeat protein [Pyrinomonadaceae bacterium]|jgi:tetratricopeptide (TPR) repeat protein